MEFRGASMELHGILWSFMEAPWSSVELEMEMEMEMEMVFNGYSLTGFSITIYNNIIIINTKILMYNK